MYQNTSRSRSLSNLMRSRSSSSVGGGLPGGRNYRMSVNRYVTTYSTPTCTVVLSERTLRHVRSLVVPASCRKGYDFPIKYTFHNQESAREQEHISRRQEMAVDQATRGGYKSSVEKTAYTPPASLSPYSCERSR